ncbi:hypothetical protein J2S15_003788 [Breznakia pachnodae]|uniref:LPXTG cell wall anchor domain-containing protein n=1 Tax=Breznakia pachnodae TaxID=265178 RepID=A0ABU0E801_9FIRM|nr:hypothetical protein [Breznakia pachnodae]
MLYNEKIKGGVEMNPVVVVAAIAVVGAVGTIIYKKRK